MPNVPRDEFGEREDTHVRVLRFLEARMQRLEVRDASFFGSEGVEGAWPRHRKEHEAMKTDVDVLKAFRMKALLVITLGGGALGLIAEIVSHLLEKAWH